MFWREPNFKINIPLLKYVICKRIIRAKEEIMQNKRIDCKRIEKQEAEIARLKKVRALP